MGLILRKTFNWQEDLENFDWMPWVRKNSWHSGRKEGIYILSFKGKLRKFFNIKKGTKWIYNLLPNS